MSEPRVLYVAEARAAAERVLGDPDREAVRISQVEIVSLCALVEWQHEALQRAGIGYPQVDPSPAFQEPFAAESRR